MAVACPSPDRRCADLINVEWLLDRSWCLVYNLGMTDKLPPYFIDLVLDAALKSFWTKKVLQQFLRRCDVSEQFIAIWTPEESKREFLYRLFPLLEKTNKGKSVIKLMATRLSEQ